MRTKISILIFIILILSACNNALFDSGEMHTYEIRFEQPIMAYEAESIFDVTLVQDSSNQILVTCGENLYPYVSLSLRNDTLHLQQHTKTNWSRKYKKIKLEIHVNHRNFWINIREPISLSSSDTIKVSSFVVEDWGVFSEINLKVDADNLWLVNSPDHFGLFQVKGKSKNTFFWNRGSCKFMADSLDSQNSYVKQNGAGNIYLTTLGTLTVSLENTGNVFYKGNPTLVEEQKLSTGKAIKND